MQKGIKAKLVEDETNAKTATTDMNADHVGKEKPLDNYHCLKKAIVYLHAFHRKNQIIPISLVLYCASGPTIPQRLHAP